MGIVTLKVKNAQQFSVFCIDKNLFGFTILNSIENLDGSSNQEITYPIRHFTNK